MIVPAVAVNVAVVELAATVTDAGTVSNALLSDTVTVVAAVAAFDSVIVHVLLADELTLVGVHTSDVRSTGATRLMLAVWVAPLNVAVTVAVWSVAMLPAVAVKVALVAPAPTVTEAGTVSTVPVPDSAIVAPPAGAAVDSVTVQVAVVPLDNAAGEHRSDCRVGAWTVPVPVIAVFISAAICAVEST